MIGFLQTIAKFHSRSKSRMKTVYALLTLALSVSGQATDAEQKACESSYYRDDRLDPVTREKACPIQDLFSQSPTIAKDLPRKLDAFCSPACMSFHSKLVGAANCTSSARTLLEIEDLYRFKYVCLKMDDKYCDELMLAENPNHVVRFMSDTAPLPGQECHPCRTKRYELEIQRMDETAKLKVVQNPNWKSNMTSMKNNWVSSCNGKADTTGKKFTHDFIPSVKSVDVSTVGESYVPGRGITRKTNAGIKQISLSVFSGLLALGSLL